MSKRKVRRLYEQACTDYQRGIVDAARYPSMPSPNLTTEYAYRAGFEDARKGYVQDAIRMDAWVNTLALGMKRWAFPRSRHGY